MVVTQSAWNAIQLGTKDPALDIGQKRYYFIDGLGCLEAIVMKFDECTVTVQLKDNKEFTSDYEPLGIIIDGPEDLEIHKDHKTANA